MWVTALMNAINEKSLLGLRKAVRKLVQGHLENCASSVQLSHRRDFHLRRKRRGIDIQTGRWHQRIYMVAQCQNPDCRRARKRKSEYIARTQNRQWPNYFFWAHLYATHERFDIVYRHPHREVFFQIEIILRSLFTTYTKFKSIHTILLFKWVSQPYLSL